MFLLYVPVRMLVRRYILYTAKTAQCSVPVIAALEYLYFWDYSGTIINPLGQINSTLYTNYIVGEANTLKQIHTYL